MEKYFTILRMTARNFKTLGKEDWQVCEMVDDLSGSIKEERLIIPFPLLHVYAVC